MQQGAELKGDLEERRQRLAGGTGPQGFNRGGTYGKVYSAGAGVTRDARTKAPYRLQVVEKLPVGTNRLKSAKRSRVTKPRLPFWEATLWREHGATSRRLTLTRCGRTLVIMDVYRSTTGGKPTSSWALEWPGLFIRYWDFLHQGTKFLYSSTWATTSYISCIENLKEKERNDEKDTEKGEGARGDGANVPDYPTLGVLLPLIGEADEIPALGSGRHRVPVVETQHFGSSGHQDATG